MPRIETPSKPPSRRKTVLAHIRATLLTGIVLVLPVTVTLWLFTLIVLPLDGFLQPLYHRAFGRHLPGLGFVTLLLLVYLAGLIARNVAGRMFFGGLERVFSQIPVARSVYHATKE